MSYREAYEVLKNQTDKRLLQGSFWNQDAKCGCALGTILKDDLVPFWASHHGFNNILAIMRVGFKKLKGMTNLEAYALETYNDLCIRHTIMSDWLTDIPVQEERYKLVLEWLRLLVEKEEKEE